MKFRLFPLGWSVNVTSQGRTSNYVRTRANTARSELPARTRADWSGPSERSVLCSQHFESSCFDIGSELAAGMGIQKRRKPRPDAVPTVFDLLNGLTRLVQVD